MYEYLPKEVMGIPIMWDLADYAANPGSATAKLSVAVTGLVYFGILWVVEYVARAFWYSIDSPFTRGNKGKNLTVLGRHTMDVFGMYFLVFAGCQALIGFGDLVEDGGGFLGFRAMSNPIIINGVAATPGAGRGYAFSPAAQRLCVFQIAYELKNFVDALRHSDGIVFLVHHAVTLVVACLATRPTLHLYSCFFFGLSELSTLFLCVLACFDDKHGIPGLGTAYPTLMTVFGVLFGLSFTAVRVVIWPIANYYWWTDMFIMLKEGTFHSVPEWWTYMIISFFLTFLQFYWFTEIVSQASDLLKNGGKLVISRDDDDSVVEEKKKNNNKRSTVTTTSKGKKAKAEDDDETELEEVKPKRAASRGRSRAKSPAAKKTSKSPAPRKRAKSAARN